MTCYFYIRVSTEQQNCENQKYELRAFARRNNLKRGRYIEEVISSRKPLSERKLGKLLKRIKKDDIIVTTEISRLGRSILEIMGILQQCMETDCKVMTVKENYRLGDNIQSKILAFAFSLAAEIERNMISERTKQSLRRLKNEGKKLGRPKGETYKKLQEKQAQIQELLAQGVCLAEIARIIGCSWSTLKRFIMDMQSAAQNENTRNTTPTTGTSGTHASITDNPPNHSALTN